MEEISSGGELVSNSRLMNNRLLSVPPDGLPGVNYIRVRAYGCGLVMPFPGVLRIWYRPGPPTQPIPPDPPDFQGSWSAYSLNVGFIDEIPGYMLPIYEWFQCYQTFPVGNGWAKRAPSSVTFHYMENGQMVDSQVVFPTR